MKPFRRWWGLEGEARGTRREKEKDGRGRTGVFHEGRVHGEVWDAEVELAFGLFTDVDWGLGGWIYCCCGPPCWKMMVMMVLVGG